MKLSGTFGLVGSAALALLLSACMVAEPAYPVRAPQPPPTPAPAPPPPPPPPPPRDPDAPLAAPSSPIQSRPLPPIGSAPLPPIRSAPPAATASVPAPRASVPTAAPAPPRPAAPQPAAAPAAPNPPSPWVQPAAAAASQGVTVVRQGETIYEVAERVRTPVRALIEANNLREPYAVTPGTRLKVPPPLFYVIADGDTLYGVARRFSIEPRSLASLNNIAMEVPIRPGQVLALPALAKDRGATQQANGPSPAEPAPAPVSRVAAAPARPATPGAPPIGAVPAAPPIAATAPAAPAVGPAPAPSPEVQAAIAGRGRFNWPVQGEVLSTFGAKGLGQRNDGLNIAAASGENVRASAAGEVVFAGELPSFGNLVLLKHPGGFVTAYAHLSKIAVKMREQVMQGQQVGLAGQTGLVDRPQVHFEIRYAANPRDKAAPVDPTVLLPGAG